MANITDFLTRKLAKTDEAQEIGIGGFTAMARIREGYKLAAEVPTTPVEDGSFVNDHIILKPLTVTIEGDVSDVHRRANPLIQQLTRLQGEVANLAGQYAPARTQSQIQKVNALANDVADAVRRADAVIDAGAQAVRYFGNLDAEAKTLREQFLDAMEALHYGRQVISIDMPYRRLDNMVITSFQANTDNEADSTRFTIEAQQILYAELQYTEAPTVPADGLNGQIGGLVSKGVQSGTKAPASLLSQVLAVFR